MSANANKVIVIALLGGIVAFFLHVAGKALAPFALAAVAAYIVSPLANKMEERGVKPSAAAGLLTLLIVLAVFALPLALLPLVISQLAAFAAELPALVTRAGDWLGEVQPHLVEQLQALNPIDAAKRAATAVGAEGVFKTVTLAAGIFGQGVSAVYSLLQFCSSRRWRLFILSVTAKSSRRANRHAAAAYSSSVATGF